MYRAGHPIIQSRGHAYVRSSIPPPTQLPSSPRPDDLLLTAWLRSCEKMKRYQCVAIETLVMLSFAAVALAFQTAVRLSAQDSTAPPAACSDGRLTSSTRTLIPNSYWPARCCCARVASRDGDNKNSRVVMMARSNRLKTVIARQRNLEKSNAPVILSEKAKRKAKRERRAYFRERYACSGRRLIKLQQEDPDSLYIGFVGTNGAGRAQALGAVEAYLKRATEFKVQREYTGAVGRIAANKLACSTAVCRLSYSKYPVLS